MSTRREFHRTAAAFAAGLFAAGTPRVQGAESPADRVRVGFIGTGNQGTGLLKRILQHDLAEVVACCDVNAGSFGYKQDDHFYGREPAAEMVNDHNARRRLKRDRCVAVKEHERVLDRDDVDAVFVVVPDHSHRPITLDACAAGKHIYCEKPLSHSVADGRAMVDAAAKAGVVNQTGSHERSNPASAFVCEAVGNGLLGGLTRIVTTVGYNNKTGPGPGWEPTPVPATFDYARWLGTAPKVPYHEDRCLYRFRFNYDYSGGQITNFGAHSNDMALWGAGLDGRGPETVRCDRAEFLPEGSLFDTATETVFTAALPGGVELRCESGPEQVQTRFEGPNGWVQTGYRGTTASDPNWLDGLPDKTDEQGRDPLARHMADFFGAIRGGGPTRAPFTLGHNTATLCHVANAAIKLFPERGDAPLRWDHAAERFVDDPAANVVLNFEGRA